MSVSIVRQTERLLHDTVARSGTRDSRLIRIVPQDLKNDLGVSFLICGAIHPDMGILLEQLFCDIPAVVELRHGHPTSMEEKDAPNLCI